MMQPEKLLGKAKVQKIEDDLENTKMKELVGA